MLSTQRKLSIGYAVLTILGVLLIHTVFFAPQGENLSYRDFKTLLKAGKIIDLTLGERTITGRLTTDGLEGLLPLARIEAFRRFGRGEQRFMTVQLEDPLAEYAPLLDRPRPGVRGHLGILHAAYGPGQRYHEHRQEQSQGIRGPDDSHHLCRRGRY